MVFSAPLLVPLLTITITSLVSFLTNNWIVLWIVLELSTIAFIVFLTSEVNNENIIVFFIFQSLPSVLLIASIFNLNWSWEQSNQVTFFLVVLSIFINIGIFPFNTWIINFNNNIGWILLTILLTWQNIIPLLILLKWTSNFNIILILSAILLLLSIILVKTTSTNVLLSVSSIIHNLWFILPIFIFNIWAIVYLIAYSMIISIVNFHFINLNLDSLLRQYSINNYFTSITVNICSIGGVPPTLGFFLNIVIIFLLIWASSINMSSIVTLIMASSLSFFVYSQLITSNNIIINMNPNNTVNNINNNLVFSFMSSIPTPMLIFF